jgi:hypothetical protein
MIAIRLWWMRHRMIHADNGVMVTGRNLTSIATVLVLLGTVYFICLLLMLCFAWTQTTRSEGSTSLILFPVRIALID